MISTVVSLIVQNN